MRILYTTFLILFISAAAFGQQKIRYALDKDIAYGDANAQRENAYLKERCRLDLYYPVNKKNFATVVWFHGGGLTGGNPELPEALLRKGIAVIGVGYRLSPRATGEEIIRDAAAAVAWTFQNIKRFGGSDSLIFVSGHSAGAYLGMMLTLDRSYLRRHDLDANRIAGLIPLSGQAITHFTIRKERGMKDTQAFVDQFSPLYHARADAPPMLLITGNRELEMLGRYEENAYLERMMKLNGHKETRLMELDGYGHNMTYPAFPLLLDEVRRLTTRLGYPAP
ncbi:lipase [Pedobacter yulinensis]|uniref:Lipase n=1 Tax=Pedobacter yulinensis TaxID=2126353 RepID=A0A2T3HPA5_9SPHI|nr:alpha/beta hydrolase fold domain-containing protein [Pedobacter yulinensis]PST84285.1 lipase [Pedobacter yulinensis]